MNWLLLLLAGLCEIGWAIGLKYAAGFSRFWPSVFTIGSMALSVLLLGLALRSLPLGTAYGVWVGIGTLGTSLASIWLFAEPASGPRLVCLLLILMGIIGLKVFP